VPVLLLAAAAVLAAVWAVCALVAAAELVAAATRVRLPRPRLPAPLHRVVTGAVGATVMALTAAARPAPPSTPAVVAPQVAPADAATGQESDVAGQMTVLVAGRAYTHTVRRGDTLWEIAGQWLGDPRRWPEIYQLNRGRHWPHVGGTLSDPDLIHPGWVLDLPDDARPPGDRSRPPDRGRPPRQPTPPGADDGVTVPPTQGPAVSPSPAGPAEPVGSAAPSAAPERGEVPRPGEHGVDLPGGNYLPWAVAAAVAASVTLLWRQRQRRYVPRPPSAGPRQDADLRPPPTVVRQVTRAWQRHARPDDEDDELAPAVQAVAALPAPHPARAPAQQAPASLPGPGPGWPAVPGGVALSGPGAWAAARGALVAALSAGGPGTPGQRTEVVIPADTLTTLLGREAAPRLPGWPRLRPVADLPAGLATLEARLLHTARILDQHEATPAATEAPVLPPPLLLIADAAPPGARARTATILALGADRGVYGLLVGDADAVPAIQVDEDGQPQPAGALDADRLPPRLPVVDEHATADLLRTLYEAHTGNPPDDRQPGDDGRLPGTTLSGPAGPAAADPGARPAAQPAAPAETGASRTATEQERAEPAAGPATATGAAQVRVLGIPDIDGVDAVDRPVRSAAIELMVYLAVHGESGATAGQILEDVFGDRQRSAAPGTWHTAASNLRHLLGEAAGRDAKDFVVKQRGRYTLAVPDAVDVDLWRVHEHLFRAARAPDEPTRLAELRHVCRQPHGVLAGDAAYEWIEPHRQAARRQLVDAHTALAAAISDADPAEAARLLDAAIDLDPLDEELCRRAMRARHRLGDADAVRAQLRRLADTLDAELDVGPSAETLDVARTLLGRDDHSR
jgi:DNA-binding SARP family transcriptional activator